MDVFLPVRTISARKAFNTLSAAGKALSRKRQLSWAPFAIVTRRRSGRFARIASTSSTAPRRPDRFLGLNETLTPLGTVAT